MSKFVKIADFIFLIFFTSTSLLLAADPVKDPFYTQGQEMQNPPVHSVKEFVDPFSGYLTLLHTDAFFPGNGGLDLTILRRYNSAVWGNRENKDLAAPKLVAPMEKSPLGLGWSLHMGIMRWPGGASPVVEMPDGSKHTFYVDKTNTKWISKDFWICKNIASGVWEVTQTDGTVYTFTDNINGAPGYTEQWAWTPIIRVAQVTKIRNAANNASISITYKKITPDDYNYSYLDTITDPVGRKITFHYDTNRRLWYITAALGSWSAELIRYNYQTIGQDGNSYGKFDILSQAYLPVGNPWQYSYYHTNYELYRLTFPSGGAIDYEHSDVPFRVNSTYSPPFSVVTKRTSRATRTLEATDTWSYLYQTGLASIGNQTTITTLSGLKEVHIFDSWSTTGSESATSNKVWRVGLPKSKQIFLNNTNIYSEVTDWTKSSSSISYAHLSSASWSTGGSVMDTEIYVPLLQKRTITRDAKTYITVYRDHNTYGDPQTIEETGDKKRNTSITYWINTTSTAYNMVKNRPSTVTVSGDFPGRVGSNNFPTVYTYYQGEFGGNIGDLKKIDQYGVDTQYEYYTTDGNLKSVTDANSNKTTYLWSYGRIKEKQTPIYTIYRVINSNGTIQNEKNGRGYTTSYQYDDNFRLKKITPPEGDPVNFQYQPDNSYAREFRSTSSTYSSGYYVDRNYDGLGRPIGTDDRWGIKTTIAYMDYGAKDYTDSNIGDKFKYDYFGRVKEVLHKDGKKITTEYINSNESVIDEELHETYYTYNAFGNPDEKWLRSVRDAKLNTTTYDYNILGSLTKITQPGIIRSFTYDDKNFLWYETHPEKGTVEYTRYDLGNIHYKDDGMGRTEYRYDTLNRLRYITNLPDINIEYIYDDADNMHEVINASASLRYEYDPSNRLEYKYETIQGKLYTTHFDYTPYDDIESITYPSGRSVYYGHNGNHQINQVKANGKTFVSDIDYYGAADAGNHFGLPKLYEYVNGHEVSFAYNARNLPDRYTAGASGSAPFIDLEYQYYDSGNTWTITNHVDRSKDQSFVYDELNRLITFNGGWWAGSYTYYPSGNRWTKTINGGTSTYVYDPAKNRLSTITGAQSASYGYNNDGDLTSIGSQYTLDFDGVHNLTSYKYNNAPLALFNYDGNGLRVSKTSNGKTVVYHYDQSGKIISETDNDGNLFADYIYLHGKLIAKIAETPPAKPTGLEACVAYYGQINLGWDDKSDNEFGFKIERKSASESDFTEIAPIVPANVTYYSDQNLTPGLSYTYRIRAYNHIGISNYSNTASAVPITNPLPGILVQPESSDFGGALVARGSVRKTFTITNSGSDDLQIGTIFITGPHSVSFSIPTSTDYCSTRNVVPCGTCTFDVLFTPLSGGANTAAVSISSNATDTPLVNLPLQGTGQYILTVSQVGTGVGSLSVLPAGISCGINCWIYDGGTHITLTSVPDEDSFLFSWSGGVCTGNINPCEFELNSDVAITATVNIKPPIADFSAAPIVVSILPYEPIQFTDQSKHIVQNRSWNFGDPTSAENTSTLEKPTHIYKSVGRYTVSLIVSNSTGTDTKTITDYITVEPCSNLPVRVLNSEDNTVTGHYATLQDGYDAAVDGDSIRALALTLKGYLIADDPKAVTITGGYNCAYQAQIGTTQLQGSISVNDGMVTVGDFELVSVPSTDNVYVVTAAAGTGGDISPDGTVTAAPGSSQTFTVTPNATCSVTSVTGCGGTLTDNVYTTGAVTGNCAVTASFMCTYKVTATAGAGGSISPSGTLVVDSGTSQIFTVSPNDGYYIAYMTGCDGTLSGNTYTTGAVTADCTVTATFVDSNYKLLTVLKTGSGMGTISINGMTCDSYCSLKFDDGQTVVLTATPNLGVPFIGWSGACEDFGVSKTCSLEMDSDKKVVASFGAISWAKFYGGDTIDQARAVEQTSDGGYIMAGKSNSFNAGDDYDAWVVKSDKDGKVIWQKSYGGQNNDEANAIVQNAAGDYLIAGNTGSKGWILKINPHGNVKWQKTYGDSCGGQITAMQKLPNNEYILAGRYCDGSYFFGGRSWIFKIDENGTILWEGSYEGYTYNLSGSEEQSLTSLYPSAIEPTADGGFVVGGYSHTLLYNNDIVLTGNYFEIFVMKLNNNGSIKSTTFFSRPGQSIPKAVNNTVDNENNGVQSLAQTNDGDYLVALKEGIFKIYADDHGNGKTKSKQEEIDPSGKGTDKKVKWQRKLAAASSLTINSIELTSDGRDEFLLSGSVSASGLHVPWMARLNAQGTVFRWQKMNQYEGSAVAVKQTLDGGYVSAGFGGYATFDDALFFKLDKNGQLSNGCSDIVDSYVTTSPNTDIVQDSLLWDPHIRLISKTTIPVPTDVEPIDTAAETSEKCVPRISVNPVSLDFGSADVGALTPRTVSVQNTGELPLEIAKVSIDGLNSQLFEEKNTCITTSEAGTLEANGSCEIDVYFLPKSPGFENVTLHIASNDPVTPQLDVPITAVAGRKLTVSKKGDAIGSVTSEPAGINCGVDCPSAAIALMQNASVTLTATPGTDRIIFSGWSVDCSGTNTCNLTMNTDKSVKAEFNYLPTADFTASQTTVGIIPFVPITFMDKSDHAKSWEWDFGDGHKYYTTTAGENPTHSYVSVGTYTVTLTVTNPYGVDSKTITNYITVQACPNEPVMIVPRIPGAQPLYYQTIDAAYKAAIDNDVIKTLAISFVEDLNADRDISVSLDGGYSCDYSGHIGNTALHGSVDVNDGNLTIGNFELVKGPVSSVYNIVASTDSGGSIFPEGTLTVAQGGSESFTLTPYANYALLDVLVDGTSVVVAGNTYTFNDVNNNHRIEARFYTSHAITASAGQNGSISPAGALTVHSYDSKIYTITPSVGYHVADVLIDRVSVGAVNEYKLEDIHADHTVSATFAINTYAITPFPGSNGTIACTPSIVNYGQNSTCTITPNAGYHITDVAVDGISKGSSNTFMFTAVSADHTIAATFAINTYTITTTAGGGGTLSPSGAVTVNYGTNQAFTIIPNSGYSIFDVKIDGVSVGSVSTYTFTNITANHTINAVFSATLTIAKTGTGIGVVTSNPAGINCGAVCSYKFPVGTPITLSATPETSKILFSGWSGGCSGNGSCLLTLNANSTVTAQFNYLPTADFTASQTIVGVIPFVPITFTDKSDHATSWTWDFGDGHTYTTTTRENPTHTYLGVGTFTVSLTVTNAFGTDQKIINNYITVQSCPNLPVRVVHSDNSVAGSYATVQDAYNAAIQGDSIRALALNLIGDLKANASKTVTLKGGYNCDYQTQIGVTTLQGTMNVSSGILTAGGLVLASGSTGDIYQIVATADTGGSVSPEGTVTVAQGANHTFIISPIPNYFILEVLVDGISVGPVNTYTFNNVTTNHTINATFSRTYAITASAAQNGTISPAGSTTVVASHDQTFTITPSAGYHVADVLVDGVSAGPVTSYTFANITADHSIAASFAINTYTITATSGLGGSISPSGAISVPYGESQTFTMTADTVNGYLLLDVLVDGVSMGAVNTYTFNNVSAEHTIQVVCSNALTVTKSGSGAGTVISSPAGINCGADCSIQSKQGNIITLTAVPDATSLFVGWSGGGCSGIGTCTVTLNTDTTVTAIFSFIPPVADFSGTPTTGSQTVTVTFTDLSAQNPTGWLWDFGDGTASTLQNPTHTYSVVGTYDVKLTASNVGGLDTVTKTGYINIQSYVKIAGSTSVYGNIQEAYNAAQDGATIQVRDITAVEDFDANATTGKTIILEGGYNSTFTSASGVTTLKGSLKTTTGKLTVKNFILQK